MGYDVDVPIVIAGSGRSGTSWLIEAITLDTHYRPIFEPLHFKYVPNVDVDWWNKYLCKGDNHKELEDHFQKVFHSRPDQAWYRWMHFRVPIDASWYQTATQYAYYLPNVRPWAKQRVVKMIKGNLLLEWLHDRFQPRIVFISRHPCAVVASRMAYGGWQDGKSKWMRQRRLIDDHLQSKMSLVRSIKSPVQMHALNWCVENFLPMLQLKQNLFEMHHVRYRDLVLEPEESLANLLNFIRLPSERIPGLIRRIMRRKRPSPEHVDKWKTQLDASDIDFIFRCAEEFELPVD